MLTQRAVWAFLCLASQNELDVLAAVFFYKADQFIVVSIIGESLHHVKVKHVRETSVPDGQDLFPNGFSYVPVPPSGLHPPSKGRSGWIHCPRPP